MAKTSSSSGFGGTGSSWLVYLLPRYCGVRGWLWMFEGSALIQTVQLFTLSFYWLTADVVQEELELDVI